MAKVVVKKFGGSSVKDTARIRAVATHIAEAVGRGERVVAVVSAMGKTTDALMDLAHEVSPHPDRRELDMLLTAGERISMSLIAMAVRDQGVPATSLTGSQCGIITNDQAGAARIVEVRPYRVEDALDAGHVVIVAGFQGVSYRREVTTLGRGGSDTTAVALAAALGAEACEIYTDVDGVYSADPRVVIDAKRLSELSYDEMLELARGGAKVLAEEAVSWARDHQIALFVKASDARPGETLVRRNPPQAGLGIVGVCQRPDAWLCSYPTRERKTVLAQLSAAAITPLVDSQIDEHRALLLFARDVADEVDPRFEAMCQQIQTLMSESKSVRRGTLVSIVGTGVGRDHRVAERFDEAVQPIVGQAPQLSQGLTRSVLVEPSSADAIAQALHQMFFGGQSC
ncbi:MAG TPA: aspartate kinase [Myxococcales bacterium]|nr:aspartate kinase [Myxococcales bacterium]HAN32865.1 aspartate kinase [Myxococcales bacterium]